MSTKKQLLGGSFAGAGIGIFLLEPLSVSHSSLGLTLFTLGMIVAYNVRLALGRQIGALLLSAMAGVTIPALLTDPQKYWLMGLIAYVMLACAYRACKSLGEPKNGQA